jgi:hypothetical protein
MTYKPHPTKTEGNLKEVRTSDDNVTELLEAILKQLKIMNLHLTMMSDQYIRETEVE